MGHCDSPAHDGGYGGVCRVDGGIAEGAAGARGHGDAEIAAGSEQGIGAREAGFLRATGKWLLLLFVRFYQIFLSPFFGGACKFYPSCSKYGYEAIARHGAWRGSVLAAKRLLRCRPFTKGGFDPVPGLPDVNDQVDLQSQQGKPFVSSAQDKQEFAQ
jgi:uncharacterized protein